MIKDNSLKRSYRTKIIICLMLILSTVLYACGGTSDDDNIQKTEEKITSEEEITELVAKAIDESEYDLDDFLRVDPEVLDQVLQKRMKEELPSEIEISYFTGSEWKKTLHYCEIAEGSNLSENQKELYREYSSLVEEALEIFYPLKDVYESYGGFTMPSEEYKKFENGRNKMETIKYNYDNTVYQEFYIVNALKNSKIGRLKDIISGDGDLNYYYATNVIDGAYMGDEDYCILTDRTFPERGTYTLLVYFPDYIELESEDGFVKEVLACIVVTENEIEKFNTEYYACQEKEKEIRSRLTQAKNRILEATDTTPVTSVTEQQNVKADEQQDKQKETEKKVTTGYEDQYTGHYTAKYDDIDIVITASSSTEYYLTYSASGITLKDIPISHTNENSLMFFSDDYYPEHAGYIEICFDDVIGYSFNAEVAGMDGTGGYYDPLVKN